MSDVEYRLPGPEYEAIAWVHNEHFTASIAPLEQSLRMLTMRTAADGLPASIYVNGYGYGREFEMRAADGPQDESIVLGWRERRLPAVDAAAAHLEAFRADDVAPGGWREALQQNETVMWDAFRGVHADTMGQVFPASALWMRLYLQRFGEARREDALAMLGGYANASTERAAALWDLGRLAAGEPAVIEAVARGVLPAPEGHVAREFLTGWADLIARCGCTTTMHLLDLPTWAEDPATPLRMIAAMAADTGDHDPRAVRQHNAERREVLEGELTRLADGGDAEADLLRQVHRVARHLGPASEDHNLLCDQRLIAASRGCWLQIGGHLVAGGALAATDDVFYLTLDEAVEALEGSATVPAPVITERRALQAAWRASNPPARLGRQPEAEPEPRTLRGVAASRGVYRGRARVVRTLPDAVHVQPGDVLVCPATSPEWTPYFGVVGALVTGTGSLLAHAAVVAREFGIPAVVGANGAMQTITDGVTVVVDGTNGVVTIQD